MPALMKPSIVFISITLGNKKIHDILCWLNICLAECPVCGDMVPHKRINVHLDTCLTRTEKKSSLRRFVQ